jgi:acyl-CoA dehydrogenase
VNWLAASVGWDPEEGFVGVSIAVDPSCLARSADGGSTAPMTLSRTPWGRIAGAVYALAVDADSCRVARIDAEHWTVRCGVNLAGEPRDALELDAGAFDAARLSTVQVDPLCVLAMAALLRAAQMVGAMERTLDLALEHARTRIQFGRPISGFQAVQQMLAQHANHVAAAAAAVDLAVDAWGSNDAILCAGIAKSRAGEAAGLAAECAHQVVAAMGYAMEHPLQRATRRLWSWRDEYGNEAFWNERIGADVLASGADNAWALLADRTTSSLPQMP